MADVPQGKGWQAVLNGEPVNFCDLDQGGETLRKPFGLFLGRCCRGQSLHCPEVPGCCLQGPGPPAVEVDQALQGSPERMLWKRVAVNHVPATTCRAIAAARTGRCRRDGSALAGAGLCLLQVGSAQRWPRQGSGKTPHQLQRNPGQRQLEIPAEGQQRLPSLSRVCGSGCGRCQPHRDGFVGGSAAAPRSQFPVPVSYRGDILPPLPQNEQTQSDPHLTWGGLSVRSISCSGLTSSGAE